MKTTDPADEDKDKGAVTRPFVNGAEDSISDEGAEFDDLGSLIELPIGESQPQVFPPGVEIDDETLMTISPKELVWTHRSAAGLAHSLIMMVDDEELNIEMTQAFLQEAGYTNFAHTSDSRLALDMMRARPPATLLLDLSMPHVGGMEILNSMRGDKQLRHIPVIVLTSTIDAPTKLKALASGAMDFLSKPVDPSELALRLRNTLAASAYRDFLAEHDPLTGLPNRARYRKIANEVMAAGVESGCTVALVHVGVDKLGPINDAMGRTAGDQVLQRLAKRLASSVATEVGGELSSDVHEPTLFRYDGDEFAVVVPHVESHESAASFISKLLDEAVVAFSRNGQDIFATCSIGISMFPQDGKESGDLMGKASLAMKKAKEEGRNNYEFYSRKFNDAAASRLSTAAELRRAFSQQEVEIRYEPRLDAVSGKVVAAEAVPYWAHPSGRIIAGDELLDLAGATDVAALLGAWFFEQVQRTVNMWVKAGINCVPVRLSVSLAQVSVPDLIEIVRQAMKAGSKPELFILELQQIPALDAMRPLEVAAIEELADLGFTIALGRFGAGQSSLNVLSKLPFSQVRLDASLMNAADADARGAGLFDGTVALIQNMGLTCVVAGVTNLKQLVTLRRAGATQYQGPVVDQPLPPMDFVAKRLTLRPETMMRAAMRVIASSIDVPY